MKIIPVIAVILCAFWCYSSTKKLIDTIRDRRARRHVTPAIDTNSTDNTSADNISTDNNSTDV